MWSVIINGACLIGLLLVIHGVWLAWPPLAYCLAGALLCTWGVKHYKTDIEKGGK